MTHAEEHTCKIVRPHTAFLQQLSRYIEVNWYSVLVMVTAISREEMTNSAQQTALLPGLLAY